MTDDFFSTQNLIRLARKLLLIGLALLLVIEAVMWIFVRVPINKNMTVRLNNHFPGLKQKVALTFDAENQLRSLNWTPGLKAPGSLRILCVGGTSTYGQFQNAADTWWGQLASQLESALPGVKIEIGANASNQTSLGAVKWAASHLDAWKPDLIITSLGASDVLAQPLEYRYDAGRYDALPSGSLELSGWKKSLLSVSQIARWFRSSATKMDTARAEQQIGGENYYVDHIAKLREEMAKTRAIPNPFRMSDADPRKEYQDALKRLLAEASTRSIRVILSGEPCLCTEQMTQETEALRSAFILKSPSDQHFMKVESGWVEREIRRFQEVAQELAEKEKVPFVELNGEVPQDAQNFVTETVVTDVGATKMASLLLPKVQPVVKELSGK